MGKRGTPDAARHVHEWFSQRVDGGTVQWVRTNTEAAVVRSLRAIVQDDVVRPLRAHGLGNIPTADGDSVDNHGLGQVAEGQSREEVDGGGAGGNIAEQAHKYYGPARGFPFPEHVVFPLRTRLITR